MFFVVAAACDSADQTRDFGIDNDNLAEMQAGIWIDPNGCDHWIIDDGVEGYLSQRLDKYGKPVCSGVAPPTVAVGDSSRLRCAVGDVLTPPW